MKGKLKITALFLVLIILLGVILPTVKSIAVTLPGGEIENVGRVEFSGANGISDIDSGEYAVTVDYGNENNLRVEAVSENTKIYYDNGEHKEIYSPSALKITPTIAQGYTLTIFYDGNLVAKNEDNTYTISVTPPGTSPKRLDATFSNETNPGQNNPQPGDEVHNINLLFEGTISEGKAHYAFGKTVVTAEIEGQLLPESGVGVIKVKNVDNGSASDTAITLTNYNPDTMQVRVFENEGMSLILSVADGKTYVVNPHGGLPDSLNFVVEAKSQNEGHNDQQNIPQNGKTASATINYKVSGNIEYRDGSGMNPIGVDFKINNTSYRLDSSKAVFTEGPAYEREDDGTIRTDKNGNPIPLRVPGPDGKFEQVTEKTGVTISGDTITYSCDEKDDKVSFTFLTVWNAVISEIKINGYIVPANKLPKTSTELINCYKNQRIEVVIDDIEKAETYNIEVTARMQNQNEIIMGNFLWDYNEKNGYTGPEDKIAHAKLIFVQAKYNGKTYTTIDQINSLGGLYSWSDVQRKNTYKDEREGVGSATFPVGTELTVKLIPDAGYQLVNFGINGGIFKTQQEVGTYTFTIGGGNFHLYANFEQVDDVVKSKTDKVESGSISLGGTEKSMSIGTARLDVSDVELDEKQTSNFSEKAAEEGYTISNYLDISLYNTVYKGKTTESWDSQVKDLENEATITLQLEDGVDGNEVAIVHEKHDGTYEIIKTTYNPETNTITFKTKSFSNYAIATKGKIEVKITPTKSTEINKNATEEVSELIKLLVDGKEVKGISKELASTIKKAIEQGKTVNVEVDATEVKAENILEDAKKVEDKMSNDSKVAAYFDIDVIIKIDGKEEGIITNLNKAIKLSVTIPSDLPKVEEGYTRKYTVIRVHDGKAEELETNVEGSTITFSSDKFSTYALIYKDLKNTIPATGDSVMLFVLIFGVATVGTVTLTILNKSRKTRKH